MKTEKLRVSLAYGRGSDSMLLETAGAVSVNLYGNPSFQTPPVTAAELQASLAALNAAIAAQEQGGTAATAEKNNRRAELVALLQKLAFYAQLASDNNLATLLSSGFTMVNPNRAQTQLPAPSGLRLDNGLRGQSLLTVDRIPNARCYEINVALMDEEGKQGAWENGALVTASRNMSVNNLIPGKLYVFQTRAIGGSTGFSDWSDPVSHRAM